MPNKQQIFYVTTNKDIINGSLRQAIIDSNSAGSTTHKIIITDKVNGPIILTAGPITVSSNIIIVNQNEGGTIINGNNNQIFNIIAPSKYFKICDIILTNGFSGTNGGAILNLGVTDHQFIGENITLKRNITKGSGGAIYTIGTVLLVNSNIRNNSAGILGGGIYSTSGVTLRKCNVYNNEITIANISNGGAGIYISAGDLIVDRSKINNNTSPTTASGGGALAVSSGSVYIQDSKINNNIAYNASALQQGVGNIYIINTEICNNESTNDIIGSGAGGSAIFILSGLIFISNSKITHNKNSSMYATVVSVIGSVIVEHSDLSYNSCKGPGTIACNVNGQIVVNSSTITHNTAAAFGGALTNFSLLTGSIIVSDSKIIHNTLTDAQTIGQVIEVFLDLILGTVSDITLQAEISGGIGLSSIQQITPVIILEATLVNNALKQLPGTIGETPLQYLIAGCGLANLLDGPIIISKSEINHNKSQIVDHSLFVSIGGGIFGFKSPITINDATIINNKVIGDGGGIYSATSLFINNSIVEHNTGRNGGGIFTEGSSTIISSKIIKNRGKNNGGGIYNTGSLTLLNNCIIENKINGVASIIKFINNNTKIVDNTPNNIVYI